MLICTWWKKSVYQNSQLCLGKSSVHHLTHYAKTIVTTKIEIDSNNLSNLVIFAQTGGKDYRINLQTAGELFVLFTVGQNLKPVEEAH